VERVREGGSHLESGRPESTAGQPKLGTSAYLTDRSAQGYEIAARGAEDRDPEESVLLPAVTARPFQVGVAETVASTPDHKELVVGRRP
jgi:hypothetical protein